MKTKRKAIIIIMCSVAIIAVAQILLKYGVSRVKDVSAGNALASLSAIFSSWVVLLAVALLLVSSTLWLIGLSKAELSFAYPLLGTGYAVVAFLSWILFGEALSAIRLLGIAAIITGVVMMSRS